SSTTSNSMVFPWIASPAQLRPSPTASTTIPVAHYPVFVAWNHA
ncbi:hypothetical protein SOVF_216240, partial [Spinacia oleracea]